MDLHGCLARPARHWMLQNSTMSTSGNCWEIVRGKTMWECLQGGAEGHGVGGRSWGSWKKPSLEELGEAKPCQAEPMLIWLPPSCLNILLNLICWSSLQRRTAAPAVQKCTQVLILPMPTEVGRKELGKLGEAKSCQVEPLLLWLPPRCLNIP